MIENGIQSKLFQPLSIGNGKIKLDHRIIFAPLTRNRGVPLNAVSSPANPNRIWYPGDLMVEYYRQRTTKGGLLISEGIPPSLEVQNSCFSCFSRKETEESSPYNPFSLFPSLSLPSRTIDCGRLYPFTADLEYRAMECLGCRDSLRRNKQMAGGRSWTPCTKKVATFTASFGMPAGRLFPR